MCVFFSLGRTETRTDVCRCSGTSIRGLRSRILGYAEAVGLKCMGNWRFLLRGHLRGLSSWAWEHADTPHHVYTCFFYLFQYRSKWRLLLFCFFPSGPNEGQEVACETTHMFEVSTDSVDYILQPICAHAHAHTHRHTHTKSHMTCIDIDDSFWISCTSMTGLLPEVLPKSLHYAGAEHGVRPRRRTPSPLKPWNETLNLRAMDQNGWNLPGDAQFVEHFARGLGIL